MADEAADHRVNFTSSRFRDFCATNPARPTSSLHAPISHPDPSRFDQSGNDILDNNNIPPSQASNETQELRPSIMKCCCGSSDCSYLEHNNEALGGLERDLETAARLGQALLDRHEAYVKESQAEQTRLSQHIHELEHEKTSLQDANHKIVVENRELLQKLEQLNVDFGESGKRVHELEDLLQDYEQEIRRLNGLTRKTQDLELKVLDMEREHADLSRDLADGQRETRSTVLRWKDSEKKVRQLEQEVQRIEYAARVDREKHEELVARMERDRSLERELGLSEGRLKATAAVQTMQKGGTQKQVVSNFVRDILQDNANLQAGIAELRELLQSSNDEVQNLREQVMLHQPVQDEEAPFPQRTLSLSDELSQSLPQPQVQQELHVHHHYHTNVGSKKEKTPVRKAPRRKALMPPSILSSSPASSGVSTPMVRPQRFASSPTMPFSAKPGHSGNNRWSIQSTATNSTYMSSMASSPRSYHDRNNSIFDRLEQEEESSRPTSPDSFTMQSPLPFKRPNRPGNNDLSVFEEEAPELDEHVSESKPAPLDSMSEVSSSGEDNRLEKNRNGQPDIQPDLELTPKPSLALHRQGNDPAPATKPPDVVTIDSQTTTPKHNDEVFLSDQGTSQISTPVKREVEQSVSGSNTNNIEIRPSVRRSNSHDSLLSISGMDIHLAQQSSRSTLALLRGHGANKHHFAPTPASLRQPLASTSQPLASVTEYTATSRPGLEPAMSASMLALSGIHSTVGRTSQFQSPNKGGLIDWVSSKWGKTPTSVKSVADLRSSASPIDGSKILSRPHANHSSSSPSISKPITPSIAPSTTSNSTVSSGKKSFNAAAIDIQGPGSGIGSSTSSSLMSSSFMSRPPGINQSGPIAGFAAAIAAKRTPTVVSPPKVDLGGLKESLAES